MARALEVPLYQLFYEGEEPPKLPILLNGSENGSSVSTRSLYSSLAENEFTIRRPSAIDPFQYKGSIFDSAIHEELLRHVGFARVQVDKPPRSQHRCGKKNGVLLPELPIQRNRLTMSDARKEKRNPKRLQVLLSRIAAPFLTEPALTENVSSHGLRALTDRPWKRESHLIVRSSEYMLWGSAKVIYCQTLPANTFVLGLEFVVRTGAWTMG